MSHENFPESVQESINPQTNPSRHKFRGILTIFLILALLGTWAYIIWDKNQQKEKDHSQQNMIVATSNQRDELQNELEDATMRYDMLKTSNSKKDSAITAKDREILEKQNRIKSLLSKASATDADLQEARGLISSLKGDIEGYKQQVEVLKGENFQLNKEKAEVIEDRNKVKQDLDSAQHVIKSKEEVINVGSTLHASNFNIIGIMEKGNGKEKETSTARRVDKFRISFDLDENLIAESGKKDIYICITGPDGNAIALESMGSGKFTTREGQEKVYTQKIEVNYTQNKRQTITFDWKQPSNFDKGNYKIEVFNNGFKVGEGNKPLKKGGLFG